MAKGPVVFTGLQALYNCYGCGDGSAWEADEVTTVGDHLYCPEHYHGLPRVRKKGPFRHKLQRNIKDDKDQTMMEFGGDP